jgi:8-oxo-dGTP diphosphatase
VVAVEVAVAGRDAARAIVIKNDKLLVMKRYKPGKGNYVVLLGGRIEEGETPEQAVVREVREESTVEVASPRLVFIEEPHKEWGRMYVFVCDYVSGEPILDTASEEYAAQQAGYGTYEPVWVPIADLSQSNIPFRTERLKNELLDAIKLGFPATPKRWTP